MIEAIIVAVLVLGGAIYVYHYYPSLFGKVANTAVTEADAVIAKANTAVANVVSKVVTSNTTSSN